VPPKGDSSIGLFGADTVVFIVVRFRFVNVFVVSPEQEMNFPACSSETCRMIAVSLYLPLLIVCALVERSDTNAHCLRQQLLYQPSLSCLLKTILAHSELLEKNIFISPRILN
jgi:hypothetical protein